MAYQNRNQSFIGLFGPSVIVDAFLVQHSFTNVTYNI